MGKRRDNIVGGSAHRSIPRREVARLVERRLRGGVHLRFRIVDVVLYRVAFLVRVQVSLAHSGAAQGALERELTIFVKA